VHGQWDRGFWHGAQDHAYTSIANADNTTMRLAEEHQATETDLRDSGLPYVLLRNSWYIENYTARLPSILEKGTLAAVPVTAGSARPPAAAAVLTSDVEPGRAYELGGDQAFTLTELAAEIRRPDGPAHQLPRPPRR
jgi:NAD(P)H dehydrogenase (quinone)